ncbi:DUF935 family protein [bacterium]|nr:DUF935 family protein [bacterium]
MLTSPPTTQRTLLNPAEAWWTGLSSAADRGIQGILRMESQAGRHQRSVHELYAEMELKDGHLFSLLQTRLNGLLSLDRRLVGGDPEARRLIEDSLRRIPRVDGLLRALIAGIARGFAVVELEWRRAASGRFEIADWIEHHAECFAFDRFGGLRLLVPPFDPAGQPTHIDPFTGMETAEPPPRKFLVLRFQADARNPYGRGLCQHAYWYYFFKKNALKYWAIFNERFGSPTAVARVGAGLGSDDRQQLAELFANLQGEAGVVVPDTVQLELLEARHAAEGATFERFLDWCNDEMSKVVLGATLTSSEGRRSGSLALGRIHDLVRQDYIDSDARLLEEVVSDQLFRWLCEVNLGSAAGIPRLQLRTESPVDQEASIRVDRELLSLGVRLPESWFADRYGRPVPQPGEPTLRYDDANFYQYHLQFGVLTINEVRQRLGLSPVPWGSARTAASELVVPPAGSSGEDTGTPPI